MKKPTQHTIDLTELQNWMLQHETTYASDGRGKRLTIAANGNLKVYNQGEVVWTTVQPYQAVQKYNEIETI